MIAGIDVRDAACFTPLIVVGLALWASLNRDRITAFPGMLLRRARRTGSGEAR